MATRSNVQIKKAREEMEYLTGEEETRRIAELREKHIRDEAAIKSLARERGLAEGMEKGRKEGIKKGKIIGIEQGKIKGARKNSIEIAKKMKIKGIDIDTIIEITGISREEIEKL